MTRYVAMLGSMLVAGCVTATPTVLTQAPSSMPSASPAVCAEPTSPEPSTSAYLPRFGYHNTSFEWDNPDVLNVGEIVTLRTHSNFPAGPGSPAPAFTLGLRETDKACIDGQGRLTAIAPGTLHPYIEADGVRTYVAIAAVSNHRDWSVLPPPEVGLTGSGTWGVYLQSPEDWKRYWAADDLGDATPVVPPVDFATSTILAVTALIANGGDAKDVVLTEIVEGASPTYRVTLTMPGAIGGIAAFSNVRGFFVLPKRSGPATLELSYPFAAPTSLPLSETIVAPPPSI